MPRMVLPSSLLWWELETNLPGPGPDECLSFWSIQIQGRSDTFFELLTALLLTKSAQQVHVSNKNKNSDGIISRDTVYWTFDGFAYQFQWIYSCRIAGQFTSNFRSRTCLTMPSLSGITIYRSTQGYFGPLIILPRHFGPILVVLVQIHMTFRPWVIASSSQVIWTPFFF